MLQVTFISVSTSLASETASSHMKTNHPLKSGPQASLKVNNINGC